MKKLFTLAFLVALSLPIFAQNDIPNWSFEKWDTISMFFPKQWDIVAGKTTPVQPSHGGTWACKLEIDSTQGGLGVLIDGQTNSGISFWGGKPYSQRPDSVDIYMKYNIVPNDSAVMLLMFKKNGVYITDTFPPIPIAWGTDTNSFHDVKFKINYNTSDTPDTVIFGIVNSDYVAHPNGPWPSANFLIIDDITFTGTGITQQLPNNGFESWDTVSIISPHKWDNSNSQKNSAMGLPAAVSISTDHTTGNYAAKIQNYISATDTIQGVIFTPSNSAQPWDNHPAFALTQPFTYNTFSVDYKYLPQNSDSMGVNVMLYKNGNPIDESSYKNGATVSSWSTLDLPLNYNTSDSPDSAKIYFWAFNCSGNTCKPLGNSVLFVDNLHFHTITGIKPQTGLNNSFSVWPNPFINTTTITYQLNTTEKVKIKVLDVLGNEVAALVNETKTEGAYNLTFDASGLTKGIYFCHIEAGNYTETRKLILINNL